MATHRTPKYTISNPVNIDAAVNYMVKCAANYDDDGYLAIWLALKVAGIVVDQDDLRRVLDEMQAAEEAEWEEAHND